MNATPNKHKRGTYSMSVHILRPKFPPPICVIGGDVKIKRMFLKQEWPTVTNPKDAAILLWTGGSDVSPSFYGETKMPECGLLDTERDLHEREIYYKYYNKPSIGICRGAQFLNVCNGGRLWQHVDQHAISPPQGHILFSKYTPQGIAVTSTHHQMMRPNKELGEVIGWAFRAKTKIAFQYSQSFPNRCIPKNPFNSKVDDVDPEIVWYKKSKSLCFQPHPEYGLKSCKDFFFFLLHEYIVKD